MDCSADTRGLLNAHFFPLYWQPNLNFVWGSNRQNAHFPDSFTAESGFGANSSDQEDTVAQNSKDWGGCFCSSGIDTSLPSFVLLPWIWTGGWGWNGILKVWDKVQVDKRDMAKTAERRQWYSGRSSPLVQGERYHELNLGHTAVGRFLRRPPGLDVVGAQQVVSSVNDEWVNEWIQF